MSIRRIALTTASVCAAAFIVVMGWGLVVAHRLAGNQVCVQDAAAARLFGAPGPGVYKFDRSTEAPARIPAPGAFAMVLRGIFHATYPGEAACGAKALTQTWNGLIAIGSLLASFLALLIAVFARSRSAAS